MGEFFLNSSAKITNEYDTNSFHKDIAYNRVEGNQSTLWTPVSSIEDGAVYMIRSSENTNLYWDLTGGYLTNGTQVQLYNLNYSHAQKFYFKKQFDVNGCHSYRLSPLFSYDKILRINSNADNEILNIADEEYSDIHLFSDKICLLPTQNDPTKFYISTCFDGIFASMLTVDSLSSGKKIKQKNVDSYFINPHTWEIVKTDYIGLNVGNKTYVDGLNEFRYVARVPHLGKYTIETRTYNNTPVDTYLRLVRDSDNTQVAQNDDGGIGVNALITYEFTTIEEFSVLVRGYSSNTQGYCFVVLRPQKTMYLTGTYDIDNQKIDRISSLNNSKEHILNLGYFPEVYANLNHDTVFNDSDWEDKKKIDRDYYLFYGHGGNDGDASVYFDGANPDWTFYYSLPNFIYADVVIWMICNGGNYDPENGKNHCMAYDTISKGANYSVGFKGEIYNLTCDKFIPKLFEALKTNVLSDALPIASSYAIQSNLFWWAYFGHSHCDIAHPILFSNEDRGITCLRTPINKAQIDRIKENYIKDNMFIIKRNVLFSNAYSIYKSVEQKASKLEQEWDDVLLVLGGNEDNPIPMAMCSDTSSCITKYFDLLSGDTIDSDCFERIMRSDINE